MSRTPRENGPKKENPGKKTSAKGQKKEQEQHGWRNVFVWIIPLAIAFVLTFISLVYSSHKWLAIAATAIAVVIFLGNFLFLAEWYVWRTKRVKKRARLVVGILSLIVFVAGAAWVYRVWVNAPRAFSMAAKFSIGGVKRNPRGGHFWATYDSKYGNTMSPIHLAIYVEITNLQRVPASIDFFSIQALNLRNEWVKLTRVDVGLGDLFLCSGGCDFHHAQKIETGNSLDRMLENDMIPHKPIRGWAFFELPEDIQQKTPYRIYVRDSHGIEATQITSENLEVGDYTRTAPLDINGERDISNYHFRLFSDPW